jgi:hypothetical protein
MPFPLAHPAAVLPLRRYCPKYLSFPVLIVGSLVPDVGYCLGRLNASLVNLICNAKKACDESIQPQ